MPFAELFSGEFLFIHKLLHPSIVTFILELYQSWNIEIDESLDPIEIPARSDEDPPEGLSATFKDIGQIELGDQSQSEEPEIMDVIVQLNESEKRKEPTSS